MVARFITGMGTGIETSTVPMYQSELCEASKRGRIVSAEPLFVGVGIVISYWFDYGMSFTNGSKAWRVPIACQVVFAFVVVVLVFGLPESPRYLYKCGRNEEALQVLCDVYDGDPDTEKIRIEQEDILEALETEQETGDVSPTSAMLKKSQGSVFGCEAASALLNAQIRCLSSIERTMESLNFFHADICVTVQVESAVQAG